MNRTDQLDAFIIGAGSAGLSALRQVRKRTDHYRIADSGPLGTKCARNGCMPSKALVQISRDYHRWRVFAEEGITGAEGLACDRHAVLRHVRRLRDHFASHMREATRKAAADRLIEGRARILGPDAVRVNRTEYRTRAIVVATGARPVVPEGWTAFGDRVLTSETLFEQEDLPTRIGVIGMGPIGLEIGQALSRLGLSVNGYDLLDHVGGLRDPEVNAAAVERLGEEFPLHLGTEAHVSRETASGPLTVRTERGDTEVDAVVAAMGVRPNVEDLGLENLGLPLDDRGLPDVDPTSMQVGDLPVYMAGDTTGSRPLLHEAADEGYIAGRNAVAKRGDCFCRRTPLRIVFSDPEIASVGAGLEDLHRRRTVSGQASFEDQGRALLARRNAGLIRVYVDRPSGVLKGAEMFAPDAEHLAHTVALAVQQQLTVSDLLQAPWYHPTFDEGLETALRDAAGKLDEGHRFPDLQLCESCPEEPLL